MNNMNKMNKNYKIKKYLEYDIMSKLSVNVADKITDL